MYSQSLISSRPPKLHLYFRFCLFLTNYYPSEAARDSHRVTAFGSVGDGLLTKQLTKIYLAVKNVPMHIRCTKKRFAGIPQIRH